MVNKIKKIVLHVGLGKTGSTAIQYAMTNSKHTIGEHGIIYPTVGAVKSKMMDGAELFEHNNLLLLGLDFEELPKPLLLYYKSKENSEKKIKEFIDGIESSIYSKKFHTLILSGEYICEAEENVLIKIKNYLSNICYELLVVLYIRKPDDAYIAHISQCVKTRSNIQCPSEFNLNFKEIVLKLDKIYGRNSVIIRFFDNYVNGWDVVSDFMSVFSDVNIMSRRVNQSFSVEALLFIDNYIKSVPVGPATTRKINLLVPWLEINDPKKRNSAKPKLRPDVGGIVMQNHRSDLEWLARRDSGADNFVGRLNFHVVPTVNPMVSKSKDMTVLFANCPDEDQVRGYWLWVVDGLLEACVVMNETLDNLNSHGNSVVLPKAPIA